MIIKEVIDKHFSSSRYLYDTVITRIVQKNIRNLGGRDGARRTRTLNSIQKKKLAEIMIQKGYLKRFEDL